MQHLPLTMPAVRIIAAISLLAFPNFLPPVTSPANALPVSQSCRITTYYKTAAKATEVGVRSTCQGVKKWGVTSKYYEVEKIEAATPPHTSGGGGSLPCEFLAAGCSNLPEKRN
ncbi:MULTISPECIES: hypothetical protein [unclassified Mesorhizobium]|uniref:hypothetical protein n=1 Tax=unclassified Mesorhizobium TaxID=325217 RepID=UPI0033399165